MTPVSRRASIWKRRTFLAALVLPAVGRVAKAAEYPAKPIKLVVPYAPGGGADGVARIVAKKASEMLGQPIVVENKGGAGAILGTEVVARAEPDGYTLLLGQSGPISINPAVYKSLPYDPLKDLAPVTMTTSYPYILVVNSDLAAGSLQEFVALVRSKPGTLNYGSTGVGAANHLVAELFNRRASLEMTHVPYRGTALAVGDLLAGQLTMVFADPISVLGHVKSGKLRALAVTSLERSPIAPEVPTVAESGYPDFEALAWHGILVPAKTPANVIETLNREFVKAVRDPETKALLANQAMSPVGSSPEAFAAFIKRDIATWKAVAELSRVTVE
ncbi:MAG: tripartite tricarboxylate transporter substrate binding protein [Alphaproteobacteria bacterium]|nr:tripartite tricarboxylate transporter substrate binding protein [Alphaproteobacteria bacterium]